MATKSTKNTKSVSKKKEIKKVEESTIEKSNISIEDQLAEMTKKYEDVLKMIAMTQASNSNQKETVEEEDVSLGCNMVYGILLSSPDGSVSLKLKYKDIIDVDYYEFKQLFKKAFLKDALKSGLIYFENEEDYNRFKIKKTKDITDEAIINIIKDNSLNDIISKFNELTQNKKNHNIVHSILYRICYMLKRNIIPAMSYEIRVGIEDYFGMKLEKGMNILNSLNLD